MPASQYDRNMVPAQVSQGLAWYDLTSLTVEGKAFHDTQEFYHRLPARAQGQVADGVWGLSKHPAGFAVRFSTDATSLSVRWNPVDLEPAMDHFPATGVTGFDLYVEDQGRWRWLGVTRNPKPPQAQAVLAKNLLPGERPYMLYLSLYNGVRDAQLGLSAQAKLAPLPDRASTCKPLCFYGTSIVQGGCASRAGMTYPAILGRWLDRPHFNFGFSGSGRLEIEVARLLAEVDPVAYVIDALPNVQAPEIHERLEPFLRVLHEAHPATPILVVGSIVYQNTPLQQESQERQVRSNQAQESILKKLREQSPQLASVLHYLPGDHLLGDDYEATVDGTHATDLGFMRIAQAMRPALEPLLAQGTWQKA